MSIPINEAELERLTKRLPRVCDELHELGASSVVVMVTFAETGKNGVVGFNRMYRREGNFFETLGLMEAVRISLHKEAEPFDGDDE